MDEGDRDLARRVGDAARAGGVESDLGVDELEVHAELAVELAGLFAGRPEGFEDFADGFEYGLDEWLLNLPLNLAYVGMFDDAVRAADALSSVDLRNEMSYACESATLLARAGHAEQARARVEANTRRWGGIPDTWWSAGEAFEVLGDVAAALGAYETAIEVAEERDDSTEVSDAYEHLTRFLQEHPKATSAMSVDLPRVRITTSPDGGVVVRTTVTIPESMPRVARNAPCPCGSGRKFRRCCGGRQ